MLLSEDGKASRKKSLKAFLSCAFKVVINVTSIEWMPPFLDKIIPGGQTGVDRAGLDAAMESTSLWADPVPGVDWPKTARHRTSTPWWSWTLSNMQSVPSGM